MSEEKGIGSVGKEIPGIGSCKPHVLHKALRKNTLKSRNGQSY
jgi:hypothetical protein